MTVSHSYMGFSTKVPGSWPGSEWFREVAHFGTRKNIQSLPFKCLVPGLVQGGSDSFIWTYQHWRLPYNLCCSREVSFSIFVQSVAPARVPQAPWASRTTVVKFHIPLLFNQLRQRRCRKRYGYRGQRRGKSRSILKKYEMQNNYFLISRYWVALEGHPDKQERIGFIAFAIRISKSNIGFIASANQIGPDRQKLALVLLRLPSGCKRSIGFIAFAIRISNKHIGFIAFAIRI